MPDKLESDIAALLAESGFRAESIQHERGLVQVSVAIPREAAGRLEPARRAAEAAIGRLGGVRNAAVVFTAHREAPAQPPHAHAAPGGAPGAVPGAAPPILPEVKSVIAVASGKGGVGKSTVAVNLAVALAQSGLQTGLLDADIYGPSLPRMLGVDRKPETEGKLLKPLPAWGLKAMSIGFMVDENTAMVWRGPMVMGALNQMLGQVAWGALDVLVVDMPPGTGDAQLTLAQRARLAGAVIVSTPQDIALLDARRGVAMFKQVNVPILGVVENMSGFACPHCGGVSHVFGHGGAQAEAAKLGVPFLGAIPLELPIREAGDAGTPIVAGAPESPTAGIFRAIAARVAAGLAVPAAAGPRIVID